MKFLSHYQLGTLMDLETEYNCNFYLPPFHDKIDCCFFDITKLKDDVIALHQFLTKVKALKIKHKFIDFNGKKLMAVMR